MTCQHCSAELPPFALFCGECGRSVSAAAVAPPVVERPVAPGTVPIAVVSESPVLPVAPDALPWSDDEPLSVDSPDVPDSVDPAFVFACAVCGVPSEPHDLFCGECGAPLPGDTRVIEPVSVPISVPAPVPVPVPPPGADASPASPATAESPRVASTTTGGARFVLQFSTGESYTVLGLGLAGRNPHAEPGEYVDHLVTIVDPGRSVSKTHFEFGQHDGVFWFSDRHSGNGSIIREPGAEPRTCEPGRRYAIVRGTRIDIGEQFVVVS